MTDTGPEVGIGDCLLRPLQARRSAGSERSPLKLCTRSRVPPPLFTWAALHPSAPTRAALPYTLWLDRTGCTRWL